LQDWVKPAIYGAGEQRGQFWPPEVGDAVAVSFRMGNAGKPEFYIGGWYGAPGDTTDVPVEMPYTNDKPQKRGFMTRGGHSVVFSDEPDNQYIRITWHKPADGDESLTDETKTAARNDGDFAFMELTKDGSVQMSNKNGSSVFLNADAENITVLSQQGHSMTMTETAVSLTDKDGNLISITDGDVTVVSQKGDVNVRGGTVNVGAGGVLLGADLATFSAVLGEPLMTWLATHNHGTGVGPSTPPIIPPPPTILSQSIKLKL